MSLKSIMEKDLLTIQKDLENPVFIYDSREYPCSIGSPQDALVLEDGGFSDQPAIVIVVRKIDFDGEAPPSSQEKITYNNTTYRVASVVNNPNQAFVKLVCVSKDRGV